MISIVLCTCNGSQFLEEQLNSFLQQTILPDEIIICDDASQDDTLDIIKRWKEQVSFAVYVVKNPVRLGICNNFENGIRKAQGPYIFLSDQDDVWLPNKIEASLAKMKKLEQRYGSDRPLLVHSDLTVVDSSLQVLHDSMFQSQHMIPFEGDEAWRRLLVQNFVTGCTILINRKAAKEVLPFPKHIVMHDWWLATVVAIMGHIGFVAAPTIYYRQHGKNSVGSKAYYSLFNMQRLLSSSKPAAVVQKMVNHNLAVAEFRQGILLKNPMVRNIVSGVRNKQLFFLYRHGIKKVGFIKNFVFYLGLLASRTK
jgi:glycosyltransferase involved in cell wall biosynthesis